MSEPQRRKIFALVRDKGVGDAKVYCSQVLGEPVEHLTLLPSDKASRIIDALERLPKEAS
jgi:hypothetical protein